MSDEKSWGAWMAAAQDGDAAAYDRLLRSILPPIRSLVGRQLRDPSGVDDVVQDVLISIHRARHTYRPERPFGPWMRTIARNAVIDAHRVRSTRLRREVKLDELDVAADNPEPGAGLDGLSRELTDALAQLPPTQREAVELLHIQDLSVAEAAERAGVSPGALRVRAHRGYKALRIRFGVRRPAADPEDQEAG